MAKVTARRMSVMAATLAGVAVVGGVALGVWGVWGLWTVGAAVGTATNVIASGEAVAGEAVTEDRIVPRRVPDLYGRPLALYAQVDKRGSYFRRMYVDVRSLGGWRGRGPLPHGTLIVMEDWDDSTRLQSVHFRRLSVGRVVQEDGSRLRLESWGYGGFEPEAPPITRAAWAGMRGDSAASCVECHAGAPEDRATVFTMDLLRHWRETGDASVVQCEEPPFSPCGPEVYRVR